MGEPGNPPLIGLYGGTFDPIHNGHLRMAVEVMEYARLSELRFIPCRTPPHRERPGATPDQRLQLLRAALAEAGAGFSIDGRELARPGPSYMVDTLTSIGEESGPVPKVLILGADAFQGLPKWHRWRDLLDLAHLLVMQRPGYRPVWPPNLADLVRGRVADSPAELRSTPCGRIHFTPVTQLDISASAIRAHIRSGRSIRYLTPDPVIDLIDHLDLYRSDHDR